MLRLVSGFPEVRLIYFTALNIPQAAQTINKRSKIDLNQTKILSEQRILNLGNFPLTDSATTEILTHN